VARELNEVGVVGLGTMGAGIAEVFARAGLSVTAVEINDEAVARGRGHVEQSTERAVSRGKLDPADRDAIFERIRFSSSMEDLASRSPSSRWPPAGRARSSACTSSTRRRS
jgi:3-hydroxybutyryl-CoA dehydrogenase